MQRLLVTYRWELWLLGGIPLVSGIVVPLLPSVLPILPRGDWLFDRYTYFRIWAVDHLATVALLAVSYSRVRRSGRNLLPLVWGCALVTVAVGELLWFTVTAVAPVFETSDAFSFRLWLFGLSLANFIVSLPVLLWFAWQALRFSLAHAFFLFLIVKAYPFTNCFTNRYGVNACEPAELGEPFSQCRHGNPARLVAGRLRIARRRFPQARSSGVAGVRRRWHSRGPAEFHIFASDIRDGDTCGTWAHHRDTYPYSRRCLPHPPSRPHLSDVDAATCTRGRACGRFSGVKRRSMSRRRCNPRISVAALPPEA